MKKIAKFDGKYRFLSNFYPWVIVDEDGITWPSTEHYYQAAKTSDPLWKMRILNAPYYKEDCIEGQRSVKSLGKSCPMRTDWDDVRLEVMDKALRMKFRADNEMGSKLAETGNVELIEGNTWGDVFFGVCNGQGENNLGKLLMTLRSEIQKEIGYSGENSMGDLF